MPLKRRFDTRLPKDISGMAPWKPRSGLCAIDIVYRIREVTDATWKWCTYTQNIVYGKVMLIIIFDIWIYILNVLRTWRVIISLVYNVNEKGEAIADI